MLGAVNGTDTLSSGCEVSPAIVADDLNTREAPGFQSQPEGTPDEAGAYDRDPFLPVLCHNS